MNFGPNLRHVFPSLAASSIASFPFVLPALFGLNWRRVVVRWVAVLMLSVLSAEAFAGAQELLFERKCKGLAPQASAWEGRWWPFTDHWIGYDPTFGYYAQD